MSERTLRIGRGGLSMFHLVTPDGTRLLTDPWFANNPALDPMYERREFFESLDVLVVSHGHADHAQGVLGIVEANPDITIFALWELASKFKSMGVANAVPINFGGSARFGDVTAAPVPSAHDSSYAGPEGSEWAGVASGFVLTLSHGYRVYFAGDTSASAEMQVIGDYWRPDLAILPVGGFRVTMDVRQAVYAATQLLRVKHVIPCHYFPAPDASPTPEALRELLEADRGFAAMMGDLGREFEGLMVEADPDATVTVLDIGSELVIELEVGVR